MSNILKSYEKDGMSITEFTRDGVTASAVIKQPVFVEEETVVKTTINEEILFETQYQTLLLEMGGMM